MHRLILGGEFQTRQCVWVELVKQTCFKPNSVVTMVIGCVVLGINGDYLITTVIAVGKTCEWVYLIICIPNH